MTEENRNPKIWRKLNAQTAVAIRLGYAAGKSVQDLAAEFGVSDSTIWNVVNYETWVSAGPKDASTHWADLDRVKPRDKKT